MEFIKEIEGAFIAPTAQVMGDVRLEKDASVWYGAVLRGDDGYIAVGEGTNIQDNSVVHSDPGSNTEIGANVTIGHACIIHGCKIGDGTLVGMGAIVLNGAKIGKNCLIGAGALVTGKSDIPDNSLVMGSPAKVIKELTPEQIAANHENTAHYVHEAHKHFAK